jgi:hypothetical protein
MGQDKRGVLPLIESQEISANVLLGLEQGVPAVKHLCNHPTSWKVSRYDWCAPCLDASRGGKDVCELMVLQIHAISDVVEVDSVIWVVSEPWHQHLTSGEG